MVFLALWYAAALVAGWIVFRVLAVTLRDAGHVRVNFAGDEIPTSLGVGFVLLAILLCLGAVAVLPGGAPRVTAAIVALAAGFGILGILDDLNRKREAGGIRGHLGRALSGGGVSTALVKAVFGCALALLAAAAWLPRAGWGMVVADALIIALAANALNMLDVRPGRALKGFWFASGIVLAGSAAGAIYGVASLAPGTLLLFVPFVIWTLAYAPIDFRRRGMMGDAGSNLLGAMLGLLLVTELSATCRLSALVLLALFQLLCEVVSISSLIDRSKLLKWIDRCGSRKPDF